VKYKIKYRVGSSVGEIEITAKSVHEAKSIATSTLAENAVILGVTVSDKIHEINS
jgi:hypothetical protein